jgi:hypothetical protein
MIAGISWRRRIIVPIMAKIQKATPVSLKLMDLANAGVAIRVVNPIINPANLVFFSLNTLHSPFLEGSFLSTHLMYKRETKNQKCTIYSKKIFFCQCFFDWSFLSFYNKKCHCVAKSIT